MTKQEPVQLPIEAQKVVNEVRAQMSNLESQLKNFIDGVLVGMGYDVSQNPTVDLSTMTILLPTKGGDEPALKE